MGGRGETVGGRRRVLFLSWRDENHPLAGGSERTLGEVARRLASAGHDVTVVTAKYPAGLARTSDRGVAYLRRGGRLSVYAWGFLHALTNRYDIVYDIQNGIPFFTVLAARRRCILVVHHVHRELWPVATGPVTSRIGWLVESRIAPLLYRRRPVIAMSGSTRDELVELGYDSKLITVVQNGCTPPPPTSGPAQRPRLVVVSRLVPHKQVDHAIRLIARLSVGRPDLRLVVVGDGYDRPRLVELARRERVAERVDFVGHVSDGEKYEWLASSWIHVFPSLKEGWGLVAVEAASVGVPTLAYRSAGGVVESVQDGETGFLVDDMDGLVSAAARLLDDAELRRTMREHCLAHADRTTWEATARGFWNAALPLTAARPAPKSIDAPAEPSP
jgi:glycosyltransferase involved in cell wall biosynthesis